MIQTGEGWGRTLMPAAEGVRIRVRELVIAVTFGNGLRGVKQLSGKLQVVM